MRIRQGCVVRVVDSPDPSDLPRDDELRTRHVFRYLVGRYNRVAGFGPAGHVELCFRIPKGRLRGRHIVEIEPRLLRVRREGSNKFA